MIRKSETTVTHRGKLLICRSEAQKNAVALSKFKVFHPNRFSLVTDAKIKNKFSISVWFSPFLPLRVLNLGKPKTPPNHPASPDYS
jgi:hypothetical protein